MPALTKEINRVYEFGNINEIPVAAGVIIYQGAAIGTNVAGYARGLQAGDSFAGFAEENVNNNGGSDGANTVRLIKQGAILLEIPGINLSHINKSVYALNDNSFTLNSSGAVYIGRISRIESSGVALVEFAAFANPPYVQAVNNNTANNNNVATASSNNTTTTASAAITSNTGNS